MAVGRPPQFRFVLLPPARFGRRAPLDVPRTPGDTQPHTARFGRTHPLRDTGTTFDLDRVELVQREEPLDLHAIKGAHVVVLDTAGAEEPSSAQGPFFRSVFGHIGTMAGATIVDE
ncbi:hypothetical protein [Propionicimonas sp. T2.31MG-18]|uniref:hypothetical protein n=1 Tax=Propionicimonas sp. T2.31MG-18 TaxID=3157620 RepID=UPI00366C6DEC